MIGWDSLPYDLKLKLLALMRSTQHRIVEQEEADNVSEMVPQIRDLTTTIVDLGFSVIGNVNAPIIESLNKTLLFSFNQSPPMIQNASPNILFENDGLTVVITGGTSHSEAGLANAAITAMNNYPDMADAIKRSYISGEFIEYDVLSKYREGPKQFDQHSQYQIGKIPYAYFDEHAIRKALINNRDLNTDENTKTEESKELSPVLAIEVLDKLDKTNEATHADSIHEAMNLMKGIDADKLPDKLKEDLLKKLHGELNNSLPPELAREYQPLINKTAIDLGLSLAKDPNLSIVERLNKTGIFDMNEIETTPHKKRLYPVTTTLVDKSGMVVTLTSRPEGYDRETKTIKNILNIDSVADADINAIKTANNAKLNTHYDALAKYREGNAKNENRIGMPIGKARFDYNLEGLPKGLLKNDTIIQEVLWSDGRDSKMYGHKSNSVTRPIGTEYEHVSNQSKFKIPGSKKIIDGAGNYTIRNAFTVSVDDSQNIGTEHRTLTDLDIKHARSHSDAGKPMTLEDSLQNTHSNWIEMLSNAGTLRESGVGKERYTENGADIIASAIIAGERNVMRRLDVPLDLEIELNLKDTKRNVDDSIVTPSLTGVV
jgi:hypothetical protein